MVFSAPEVIEKQISYTFEMLQRLSCRRLREPTKFVLKILYELLIIWIV